MANISILRHGIKSSIVPNVVKNTMEVDEDGLKEEGTYVAGFVRRKGIPYMVLKRNEDLLSSV